MLVAVAEVGATQLCRKEWMYARKEVSGWASVKIFARRTRAGDGRGRGGAGAAGEELPRPGEASVVVGLGAMFAVSCVCTCGVVHRQEEEDRLRGLYRKVPVFELR